MSDRAWLIYLCSMQGHVLNGVSTNTSESGVIWSTHCWRCGAKLERPAVSPADTTEGT